MAKKYYAVKKGRTTGIFTEWSECEAQIKGFSGAQYCGFATKKEANIYLGLEDTEDKRELPPEDTLYAYVDGSYNIETKAYGYGIVLLFPDGKTAEMSGSDNKESAASMRNVAGELKGSFLSMQYAVNNRFKSLVIYHDYEGISKWAEHIWKANLPETQAYSQFCDKIREQINLKFVKVEAHTGVELNERADILAKAAVGII